MVVRRPGSPVRRGPNGPADKSNGARSDCLTLFLLGAKSLLPFRDSSAFRERSEPSQSVSQTSTGVCSTNEVPLAWLNR